MLRSAFHKVPSSSLHDHDQEDHACCVTAFCTGCSLSIADLRGRPGGVSWPEGLTWGADPGSLLTSEMDLGSSVDLGC